MLGNWFLILKTDKEKWSSIHSILLAQPFFQDNQIVDEGNENTRNQRIGKSPFDSSFENFICLFLAVLGLGFCTGFSLTAVSESHYLVVVHSLLMAGFSCCRVQALWPPSFRACLPGSRAQVQSWRTSLLAPPHVGTSQIRNQIHVSCIGKQILRHWATKEAPFDSPQWSLVKVKSLSRVQLFVTPWTVAHQAPPSMGFSRQEYWSGLPWSLGTA